MAQGKPALPPSGPMIRLRHPGSALLCACLLALPACASHSSRPGSRETLSSLRAAFKKADANSDEQLSREELSTGLPAYAANFDEIDTDHNGLVNFAELWSYISWKHLGPEPEAAPHMRHGGR
jgi:hypothetical protein